MAAARQAFAAHGYARTTMQAVARAAGVSSATLYKHFPTKIGLAEAAIADLPERLAASPILLGSIAPRAALKAYLSAYADMLRDPETIGLIRLVVAEGQSEPALASALMGRGKQPIHDRLYAYLADCRASGRLAIDDPVRATSLLMGMINQHFLFAALIGAPDPTDHASKRDMIIESALDLFFARYGANRLKDKTTVLPFADKE